MFRRVSVPLFLVEKDGVIAAGEGGSVSLEPDASRPANAFPDGGRDARPPASTAPCAEGYPIRAFVPACRPESLGEGSFCADHGLRYPYAAGAMANAIASTGIVEEMSRAGCLGFFGAAGLPLPSVEEAIIRLQRSLGAAAHGFNLIHSPNEPELEAAVADLYVRRGVRLVEASAYMDLTLPIVRYRVHGIRRAHDGSIAAPNRVVAKVSRVEVAEKFMAPPPPRFLKALVDGREITPEAAALAARIPMAQDVTAEADSGGHTDNRPLVTLLPTLLALRDRCQDRFGYSRRLRVGAAGGISTPASAAAAFSMGAAYVLTGSVNQACVESGTSDRVRDLLAQAGQADTAMAPAADMFEMGVKVQVLKRGTMFPMRAAKLYDLYRAYDSLSAIPADQRAALERDVFRAPIGDVWAQTREFFRVRDPAQTARGDHDAKHRMALVFRWYLGCSSQWANAGEPSRQLDYQVWCGPAMGAFNEWARGSFLERRSERKAATVALNILVGAAVLWRLDAARRQGAALPPELFRFTPMTSPELEACLETEAS
ncbi:MAG: PfaD family polyunsaturated fatty acid/polyketide biosynthesis protein [Elusimicrobia bacterium]|nr:PfaD family polyunsaturated fatty acid/polyketide biosynthesis protein [Elusimicrobiota bacterium]